MLSLSFNIISVSLVLIFPIFLFQLPGAIFDITGSYTMAFVINAGLYLIGAALLIFLQCWKHLRRKRRRRSRQSVQKNPSSDLQGVDSHMEVND